MEMNIEHQITELNKKSQKLIRTFSKASEMASKFQVTMPEAFQQDFYKLVDRVNLHLMEDKDNFFGYFLFQMSKEIRFDIASPTAVNFKGAKYIIYFNPLIFLKLSLRQMESTIKHEILHILSMHLIRAKSFQSSHSKLALNIAMDLVVNKYLEDLPPNAITLDGINTRYRLKLEPYQPFEYYADQLQAVINLTTDKDNSRKDDQRDTVTTEFDIGNTHDIWEDSNDLDEKTMKDFTENVIRLSEKGEIPAYINRLITDLRNSKGELPWNLYLSRLMGTVESNKKKTITRRSRRQPERLELKGELRSHKANVIVAIDISGSISDEEFKQAIKEVLSIVKNYNHEITILECDDEIRRVYKVSSVKDIKERTDTKGSTRFGPVFEYANHTKVNLLIYFTDGKGEDKLHTIPKGYPVLWVISGRGDDLSLKEPYGVVKKLKPVEVKEELLDALDVPSGGFSMQNHERMV